MFDAYGETLVCGAEYVVENYAWLSAAYWWDQNNMNSKVDEGYTVKQITKRVNGGYNGLEDRQEYYNGAIKIFNNK